MVLLEEPLTDDVNTTILDATEFGVYVVPPDAREQIDGEIVGLSFTKSLDPAVNRYGECGVWGYGESSGCMWCRLMPGNR